MQDEEILTSIITMTMNDKDSDEVQQLSENVFTLDMEPGEMAEIFCDKYELGNWFYEQLLLHGIDVSAALEETVTYKRILEDGTREMREAAEEVITQARSIVPY